MRVGGGEGGRVVVLTLAIIVYVVVFSCVQSVWLCYSIGCGCSHVIGSYDCVNNNIVLWNLLNVNVF